MKQNDKRAQICEMHFIDIEECDIENRIGSSVIKVSGDWINLNISKAEFTEVIERNGELVEQELKAVITDLSPDNEAKIYDCLSKFGLVCLEYTNGTKKVIGTDQQPVALSSNKTGSPTVIELSTKRTSPEPAKDLQSF